jgi:Zn-dependent peptidase ImmA (M78 family)/predicted secreted protein
MNRREMLLDAVAEAERLHLSQNSEETVGTVGGGVDIFGTINNLSIPLVFRPLDRLLGVFVPRPNPGIMVTTARGLAVQRFTGAHELGHYVLQHSGSLDDESILGRYPFGSAGDNVEAAADAFAASYLMPEWLLESHFDRQGWTAESFDNAHLAYQLALRIGVSYEAICRSLAHYKVIEKATLQKHLSISPKRIKQELLGDHPLENWYPDVWVLTERDRGTLIEGGPQDVFLIHLKENSGAGYLWNVDELANSGFVVVSDERLIAPETEQIGGPVERILVAASQFEAAGKLDLEQTRPWDPNSVADHFSFTYELFGKESGMPRVERKRMAAAA